MEVNTSKIYCLSSLIDVFFFFFFMFYTLPCLIVWQNYMVAPEVFPQIFKIGERSKQHDVLKLWKFSLKTWEGILNKCRCVYGRGLHFNCIPLRNV